jgi:hypothetical protein
VECARYAERFIPDLRIPPGYTAGICSQTDLIVFYGNFPKESGSLGNTDDHETVFDLLALDNRIAVDNNGCGIPVEPGVIF